MRIFHFLMLPNLITLYLRSRSNRSLTQLFLRQSPCWDMQEKVGGGRERRVERERKRIGGREHNHSSQSTFSKSVAFSIVVSK